MCSFIWCLCGWQGEEVHPAAVGRIILVVVTDLTKKWPSLASTLPTVAATTMDDISIMPPHAVDDLVPSLHCPRCSSGCKNNGRRLQQQWRTSHPPPPPPAPAGTGATGALLLACLLHSKQCSYPPTKDSCGDVIFPLPPPCADAALLLVVPII